jgi:antitoxin (DNA-binding transcriptional repressor) of toxin-antitoxin stability system
MATVTIHQAKTQLSKLIAKAEAGEEVVILRGKIPVARLTAVAAKKGKRVPGMLKGKVSLPDEFFFDPLPEEELRAWEGEYEGPR